MDNDRQRRFMGAYLRQQRKLADLSLRQVSSMVGISNPYLSQIERGLRAPSEAVAAGIATALGVSVAELYEEAGTDDAGRTAPERGTEAPGAGGEPRPDDAGPRPRPGGVLAAIAAADELTPAQRASLSEVYRSFVSSTAAARRAAADPSDPAEG